MKIGRHLTPRYLYHRSYIELWRRSERRRGEPTVPMLAMQAVQFLDGYLRSGDVMLEYGSGDSTRWFARRVGRLVSIENDPSWYERVKGQTAGHPGVELHLIQGEWGRRLDDPALPDWRVVAPSGYVEFLEGIGDDAFDVVLDDGWGRDAVGAAALRVLKAGGLLIWDDDPPAHAPLLDKLAQWRTVRWFDGVHRTTFFFKPAHL
jgi:predicted O-methyltransferase YrrM